MMKNESKKFKNTAGTEERESEQADDLHREDSPVKSSHRITHAGTLNVIDWMIPCYVTEESIRVLSGRGMQEALRLVDEEAPKSGQKPGSRMDRFLGNKALQSLLFKDREPDHFAPLKCVYRGRAINGYRAEALHDICEAMLQARDQGLLETPRQQIIAKQCDLLMRAFARVGIVGLVDEATGYQYVRDREALQTILDAYLRKELAAWAKRFPNEFYEQMFRLKGWAFNPLSVARPGVVGRYTVDLVYDRLAPGLVEELERLNPKTESGHRRARHHQRLSSEVGHPALAQHLYAVIGFMRVCTRWEEFMAMLDRAFPRKGHTIPLVLEQ
jgi:hypothetical protein